MALFAFAFLLGGPLITLGIWLWLRSRRDPIALVEPLEIGRVFSLAFRVFTADGWPVVALAVVLIGLPQIASAFLTRPMMLERAQQITAANPASPFARFEAMMTLPFAIGAIIGTVLMLAFYVAATIYLVSRFQGVPVSIGEALARAPGRILPLLGAILLAVIGYSLGLILFVLPGLILALGWIVILPVISCENVGPFGALSRSRALTIGSRGRIFVLLLLLSIVSFLLLIPGGVLLGVLAGRANATPGLFASIWSVVLDILLGAFQSSFYAALYVELRRIRDGMTTPGLADVFA